MSNQQLLGAEKSSYLPSKWKSKTALNQNFELASNRPYFPGHDNRQIMALVRIDLSSASDSQGHLNLLSKVYQLDTLKKPYNGSIAISQTENNTPEWELHCWSLL